MREGVKNHSHVSLILLALLSLYLAYCFASIYVPSAQFFLDTDGIAEQKVVVFVYDREPVALLPEGADCFVGVIQAAGRSAYRCGQMGARLHPVRWMAKRRHCSRFADIRLLPTMRGRIVSAWRAM